MSDSVVTVSLVIPLYNKGRHVAACLRSALAQTRPALEVLVVNDGSTDDGAAQVLALQAPSVRLVSQPNAGVAVARNRGIALAQGDVVAFLDADDLLHADYVATQVRLWQAFPAAGMGCTAYRRVDVAGRAVEIRHPRMAAGDSGLIADFHGDWSRRSFACSSSIAVRRDLLLQQITMFPPGERLGEDQDLWLRLAEQAPVAYCNSALADYRVGLGGSATRSEPALPDILPCYRRLGERLDAGLVPPPLRPGARRLLASHLINIARLRAGQGDTAAGMQLLLRDARARRNPGYWLRSLLGMLAGRLSRLSPEAWP